MWTLRVAWKWLQRSERLAQKVEEAFAGEPFSRKWRADHPMNIRRFRSYVKCLMEAFDLHVKACNAWEKAHGIAPADGAQWVMMMAAHADGQLDPAEAAPPGYKVVGYAPGQTLLQREEVTPEHTPITHQTVTNSPGVRPRSGNGFAHSEEKPDSENAAEKKKTHKCSQRMTQSRRTRNV